VKATKKKGWEKSGGKKKAGKKEGSHQKPGEKPENNNGGGTQSVWGKIDSVLGSPTFGDDNTRGVEKVREMQQR